MRLVKEYNFERGLNPKKAMNIGAYRLINSITSEDLEDLFDYLQLNHLTYRNDEEQKRLEQISDILKDKIAWGDYFNYKDFDKIPEYISKNAKGRYAYDSTPRGDSTTVVFSEIELPNADSIDELINMNEHVNFTRGLDPKAAMGIGLINQISSVHLNYLYDPWDNAADFKKEFPDEADLVDLVQDLEQQGVLENGDTFQWGDEENEMRKYIKKKAKGRYVYNASPGYDTVWIVFSKIKLLSAEEIE